MTALLQTRGLTKTFHHEGRPIDVLSGVDLTLAPGDRVAVVGKSGAGKSTLLHVLGALDAPTSGTILFDGVDLSTLKKDKLAAFRNRSIGFMFQFHHLLPEFSALENVMMPLLIAREPRRKARERAEHWLDQVGLADRRSHRPGELSGGEQQRVALARAVMCEPQLLLADEPTGNLDEGTSAGIHELFETINRDHGTAMLVVTHNRAFAALMPLCLEMRDGKLEAAA